MTRAGRVGVGEFIYERELRLALEYGVNIHFLERDAAIFDVGARNDFETLKQRVSFGALVGFDICNDDIYALRLALLRGFEHGEGFAYASSIAEKNF